MTKVSLSILTSWESAITCHYNNDVAENISFVHCLDKKLFFFKVRFQ